MTQTTTAPVSTTTAAPAVTLETLARGDAALLALLVAEKAECDAAGYPESEYVPSVAEFGPWAECYLAANLPGAGPDAPADSPYKAVVQAAKVQGADSLAYLNTARMHLGLPLLSKLPATENPPADSPADGASVLAAAMEATKVPAVAPVPPLPAEYTDAKVTATFRTYARGTTNALLRCAVLAHGNVHHKAFVARTHTLESALKYLAAEFGNASGEDCSVASMRRLIATGRVVALLGDGKLPKDCPTRWTTLEEFTTAVDMDATTGAWFVHQGVKDDVQALYLDTLAKGVSRELTRASMAQITAKRRGQEAERLAQKAADPKAGKAVRDAAEQAQKVAENAAERAAAAAAKARGEKAAPKQTPAKNAPKPVADQAAECGPQSWAEQAYAFIQEHADETTVLLKLAALVAADEEADPALRAAFSGINTRYAHELSKQRKASTKAS